LYGFGQQLNVASTAIFVNGDLGPREKLIEYDNTKAIAYWKAVGNRWAITKLRFGAR
jgi:hypothetical protein